MNAGSELKIGVTVNGKSIEMNEFVHKIIGNLLIAILKSLRLDEEPKEASFNLTIP